MFTPPAPLNSAGLFNWGEIYLCNSEADFTGKLSAIPFASFIFAYSVLKKGSIVIKKMVEAVHLKGAHGV